MTLKAHRSYDRLQTGTTAVTTAPEFHPASHSVRPRSHPGHPGTPPTHPPQTQATPQVHLARSWVAPRVSRVAPEPHRTIGLHPGPPRPNTDTPCRRPGHGPARLHPGYSRATSCRTPALPGNSGGTPGARQRDTPVTPGPRPPGNTQVAPGRAGNAQVSRRTFPGYPVSCVPGWADSETDAGHVGAGESLRGRSC